MNRPIHSEDHDSTGLAAPFDAVAAGYDAAFTETPIGRRKREIVRNYLAGELAGELAPGRRVLELNCGTGEDALWLSERVAQVVATDISARMIDVARRKCGAAGRTNVTLERMGIEEVSEAVGIDAPGGPDRFDLVFSNFDGLNCLRDLSFLPDTLRSVLKPDGSAILVFMSGFCAMETLGLAARGKFRRAFGRFRRDGLAVHIGAGVSVRTYFHSTRSVLRLFRRAGYRIEAVRAVGLITPPTSMRDFYHRRLGLFRRLEGIEETLSPLFPFSRMGDHVLVHVRLGDR